MEHQTASVSYSVVCSCFDDPAETGFEAENDVSEEVPYH